MAHCTCVTARSYPQPHGTLLYCTVPCCTACVHLPYLLVLKINLSACIRLSISVKMLSPPRACILPHTVNSSLFPSLALLSTPFSKLYDTTPHSIVLSLVSFLPSFTILTPLYDDYSILSSRMMMQHWMSWQEIIAQAYLFEEKTFGKNKHQRSASAPTSPVQKKKKRFLHDSDLLLHDYF